MVTSSFYTRLGSSGAGTLVVSGGQFNNSGEILFAFAGSGAGTLNVTGTGIVNSHFLRLGNNGPGTANLDGGMILANRIFSNSGQGYFYFHKYGDGPPATKGESGVPYNRNQDSFAIEEVVRWYYYWRELPGTGEPANSGAVKLCNGRDRQNWRCR